MHELLHSLLSGLNYMGVWFGPYAFAMLIQSSILIVLLLGLDLLLRKHTRAVFRYCMWLLVLVKLILPPSLTTPASIGYWAGDLWAVETQIMEPATAAGPVVFEEDFAALDSGGLAATPEEAIAAPESALLPAIGGTAVRPAEEETRAVIGWQGLVMLGWLFGLFVFGALLLQRVWFVKGLLRQAQEADGRLGEILKGGCDKLGLRGDRIKVKISPTMVSPAVCGLIRPTILLPGYLAEKFNPSQLQAVMLHELAHIKRGDLWVNLIQTIMQIGYFYHPLLWVANRMIRRVREQAVDEMVLVALEKNATDYSHTLIDIAEMAFRKPFPGLGLIGVVESRKALAQRIKHIISRPIPRTAKLGVVGLVAVLVTAAVLLPMARAAYESPEFIIKGTVTDARTGQPIIGARVGDNEKYNDGKFCTVTDPNGYYEYKTWYEEHGTTAEATGYQSQQKGFTTKLLGSEKEKVINFEMIPEKNTELSTTLLPVVSAVEEESSEGVSISEYESYFPDDIDGGKRLDALWESEGKDSFADEYILSTVRNGLQKTKHHKTLILGWIGNKYIWGKTPQNQQAIELMYHASFSPDSNVRHYAMYFGLSVVQPEKSPQILKRLMELCMNYENEDVGRIIWGCQNQQEAILDYLQPYLASPDEAVREKAVLLEKCFKGELDYDKWKQKQNRSNFSATLPNGVTVELLAVFNLVDDKFKGFQPDGSTMEDQVFDSYVKKINSPELSSLARPGSWEFQYGYILRFNPSLGLTDAMDVTVGHWRGPTALTDDGMCMAFAGFYPEERKKELPKIGDINVAAAYGTWETKKRPANINHPEIFELADGSTIILSRLRDSRNAPKEWSEIDATVNSGDTDVRLSYELNDGNVLVCRGPYLTMGGPTLVNPEYDSKSLIQYSFLLEAVKDQIKNITVEYRKFYGVTFQNISLQPGQKTDVKIEIEKIRTPEKHELDELLNTKAQTVSAILDNTMGAWLSDNPVVETPWGEPVSGVQMRLRLQENRWREGKTPERPFSFDLRNQGGNTYELWIDGITNWTLEVDGEQYALSKSMFVTNYPVRLKPGQAIKNRRIPFQLGKDKETFWLNKKTEKPLVFTLGIHIIRASVDTATPSITVVSNPVEIEIESPAQPDEPNEVAVSLPDDVRADTLARMASAKRRATRGIANGPQVSFECRILSIIDKKQVQNFLQEKEITQENPPNLIISDQDMEHLTQLTKAHKKSGFLEGPHFTVFSGEEAEISFAGGEKRPGFSLKALPIVLEDKNRMHLSFEASEIRTDNSPPQTVALETEMESGQTLLVMTPPGFMGQYSQEKDSPDSTILLLIKPSIIPPNTEPSTLTKPEEMFQPF